MGIYSNRFAVMLTTLPVHDPGFSIPHHSQGEDDDDDKKLAIGRKRSQEWQPTYPLHWRTILRMNR